MSEYDYNQYITNIYHKHTLDIIKTSNPDTTCDLLIQEKVSLIKLLLSF